MKVNIKTTNLEMTPAIEQYLERRINMIERFIDSTDQSAIADVDIGKTTEHHHGGRIFRAEINLKLAGFFGRAEAVEYDLYDAINEAKKEIVRQIKNHYGNKKDSNVKKERSFKEILRNWRF